MEQSPDNCSASQEILCLLWDTKFHYRVHNVSTGSKYYIQYGRYILYFGPLLLVTQMPRSEHVTHTAMKSEQRDTLQSTGMAQNFSAEKRTGVIQQHHNKMTAKLMLLIYPLLPTKPGEDMDDH
jgi:hypothetical protein